LAQAIVRDGEGASKFISITVEGGRSSAECRNVGYAIAHSPLVKTAFFASDPNLGRILAAIGYAEVEDLDVERVRIWLLLENRGLRVRISGTGMVRRQSIMPGSRLVKGSAITIELA
ncbi:MAG TPA: bifunctional ornithine acetyltransferase/N-acetylglutamate synthase, partial [Flavobacteriales bacterium]|nr:bifunctional ornithine acetyltransferase/N-acetylglutamate synthase [Flavobacteriales bacterium]